jgi:hypothetical protein
MEYHTFSIYPIFCMALDGKVIDQERKLIQRLKWLCEVGWAVAGRALNRA